MWKRITMERKRRNEITNDGMKPKDREGEHESLKNKDTLLHFLAHQNDEDNEIDDIVSLLQAEKVKKQSDSLNVDWESVISISRSLTNQESGQNSTSFEWMAGLSLSSLNSIDFFEGVDSNLLTMRRLSKKSQVSTTDTSMAVLPHQRH